VSQLSQAQLVEGVSQFHTSTPRDRGVAIVPGAVEHLVVLAGRTSAATRLAREWVDAGRPGSLAVVLDVEPPALADGVACRQLSDRGALERAVSERLAAATVGLRLYVVGPEAFVRRVVVAAAAAGLADDEVLAEVSGSRARRVWCAHCKVVTEGATHDLVHCAGCWRWLTVYHHFSRRLGAFMGFQADAELAGELPEVCERWP
jgi:hypothetical protein